MRDGNLNNILNFSLSTAMRFRSDYEGWKPPTPAAAWGNHLLFGFRSDYEGWKQTEQKVNSCDVLHIVLEVTMRDGNSYSTPPSNSRFW